MLQNFSRFESHHYAHLEYSFSLVLAPQFFVRQYQDQRRYSFSLQIKEQAAIQHSQDQ